MMTLRKRRILMALAVIAFLAITPMLLLYTYGYRLSEDFSIAKIGGLYISSPVSGSEIFINDALRKETNILQSGLFIQNLKPAQYSVLVAKDGYWPWKKDLTVKEHLVTEARAFLMPRNPTGEVLFKGPIKSIYGSPFDNIILMEEIGGKNKTISFYLPDKEEFLTNLSAGSAKILSAITKIEDVYWESGAVYIVSGKNTVKITLNFGDNTASAEYAAIPSELAQTQTSLNAPNHLIKYDKARRIRIWWDETSKQVLAEWLKDDALPPYYMEKNNTAILQLPSPVKSLDFLPSRSDVIIYTNSNGIFAAELDSRGGRNIQPIYKGKSPSFTLLASKKSIYVLDDEVLYKITLQ